MPNEGTGLSLFLGDFSFAEHPTGALIGRLYRNVSPENTDCVDAVPAAHLLRVY